MPPAVIDGIFGCGKVWVSEGAYGDAYRGLLVALFRMEHGRSADGAEPESELGALVTDSNVLGCSAVDLVGSPEGGQRCKDAAGSTLTSEAVANADPERCSLNLDA
jgi:hypothetical protein